MQQKKSAFREIAETVVIALLIALVIRTFVVQLYRVDGESMYPTLHHDDRLLVNKLVYRFRSPRAGEVVVLDDPANPDRQLVKRVIAVEGDEIEVQGQLVLIDGTPLSEPYTNPISEGVSATEALTVPEGYVWVMGDNRGASLDSRILGPVLTERVRGKAVALFWPLGRIGEHGPLSFARTYQ